MKIIMDREDIISSEFVMNFNRHNLRYVKKLTKIINNYLFGMDDLRTFKIKLKGTIFQIKVWNEIMKIPYGQTKTYSEIAKNIGFPKSFRAVANACGQNKHALLIPCHRVVGINNLGGYKWAFEFKEALLILEKNKSKR